MKKTISLLAFSLVAVIGCQQPQTPANSSAQIETTEINNIKAPVAAKIAHKTAIHGIELVDNYHWLRDDTRTDEKVLNHLRQENTYSESKLVNTQNLQQTLFDEIKNKVVKDDTSVPVKRGQFYYYSATNGEQEYPVYYRSKAADGAQPETLLDANTRAEGQNYYRLGGFSVTPNEQLLAFSEDTVSRRIYTIRIKNLVKDTLLADTITGSSGQIIWANDNQSFYYIKKDPVTLLGYQVYRHVLGTAQAEDTLIYEEQDNTFYTYLGKSSDKSQIYIYHSSTETSAVSVIDADNPKAMPSLVLPREAGHEYRVAKLNQWYYIYTNRQAMNFKLMRAPVKTVSDTSTWETMVAHNPDAQLTSFFAFTNHLVFSHRVNGLDKISLLELEGKTQQELSFNDSVYAAYLTSNVDPTSSAVRVAYQSMTTPASVFDVDLNSLEKTLLKRNKVLGDFDPKNYHSERIEISARDGAKVPVSLVYRKDLFVKDGSMPMLQYGYGSYGNTIRPTFSISRLSLLDRGFVYAIAHIRGSETLGRAWYEDGKKLNKKNTFNDFVDVTKGLVAEQYADPERVYARGGSAGGLLMGAVINQAPELYHGVHSAVPFVDVINTMLDESLPLTTNEYNEWGNPNNKTYFDYMLSYSPYDQVTAQDYPNLLVTTGLHDSQVQYFEPAKWVAKLREFKTDENLLLLKTDMEAGHGGASGRFKGIHDIALSYGFFIALAEGDI